MAVLQERFDSRRLIGERVPGCLYLVGSPHQHNCKFLPAALTHCSHCGQGIVPNVRWTWIQPRDLFATATCDGLSCDACAFKEALPESAGLLWVRERAYFSTYDFSREADNLGVSVRIQNIPQDFVVGETWVFLAHTKGVCYPGEPMEAPTYGPGAFYSFMPEVVEYVVKGSESVAVLNRLEARGVVLVKVIPPQGFLFAEYATS